MMKSVLVIATALAFSPAAFALSDESLVQACVKEHRDLAKCRCAQSELKKGLSDKDYQTFVLLSTKAAETEGDVHAMAQFIMSGQIDMNDMVRLSKVMQDVGMKAAKTCNIEVVMPDSPFGAQ